MSESESTPLMAGPLDVAVILQGLNGGRYHVAFFTERPMPGAPVPFDELTMVRLGSRFHHTTGTTDFAIAQQQLDVLVARLEVHPLNVCRDAPLPWDGELAIIYIVGNWRLRDHERQFAPARLTPPSIAAPATH